MSYIKKDTKLHVSIRDGSSHLSIIPAQSPSATYDYEITCDYYSRCLMVSKEDLVKLARHILAVHGEER